MDIVTHIALGSAIGQVTLNREIGNKAVLWGLAVAALPDADMLIQPFLEPAAQLTWHRGISHSILMIAILTPVLGWLIHRVHNRIVGMGKAALMAFTALTTHVLLDCFTVYGTGVFEPFSHTRIAWNSIFIIDPLYTLPLIAGVIASLFPGEIRARQFRNYAGIIISCGYIAVTLAMKFGTMPTFTRALERQDIAYTRITTAPTAFNCLLWRAVAEDAGGYWIGYHSVFDKGRYVSFYRVKRNEQLLVGMDNDKAVQTLRWFSDGWYSVSQNEEGLRFHDLRFGEFDTTYPPGNFGLQPPRLLQYVFTFKLLETVPPAIDHFSLQREDFMLPNMGELLRLLWKRIKGLKPAAQSALIIHHHR